MAKCVLHPLSGEFRDPARESAFQAERLPETLRHVWVCFAIAALLNLVFLVSDWRFSGTAHFWVAVPARIALTIASLICAIGVRRAASFPQAERWMIGWQIAAIICITALVSARTDIALMVVLMLPCIFMLVVPTSFRWTLINGSVCAVMMLVGYLAPAPLGPTAPGIVLVMIMAGCACLLAVRRANRLNRLAWAAVGEHQRLNAELVESRRRTEAVFRAVPVPLLVASCETGRVISGNTAAHGFFEADDLSGMNMPDLLTSHAVTDEMRRRLEEGRDISAVETSLVTASGRPRAVILSATVLETSDAGQVIMSLVDISQRKAAEEKALILAHRDALTGLPNRAAFQSHLEAAVKRAVAGGTTFALVLFDLDGFKAVNDTLGHDAGDALLHEVAARLNAAIGDDGACARLGGDEFVVAIPCRPDEMPGRVGELLDGLRHAFEYRGQTVAVRASLGVAHCPEHAETASDLMKAADLALYEAKAQGRNRAAIFEPAMRETFEQRALQRRAVAEGLRARQFEPFFQPKVDMNTGEIRGFEVLTRWNHPQKGMLGPAAFSLAFDDPELSLLMADQTLVATLFHIRGWLDDGLDPGRIGINLSTPQFRQPDLVGRMLDAIAEAGVPPHHIDIEVTEGVLLSGDTRRIEATLQNLQSTGIRILLDDFGTGYASLTQLKNLPVDEIKIDRSFIADLGTCATSSVIVRGLIDIGRGLSLDVVAEGVETESQRDHLLRMGCSNAQGYLYSRPVPAERVPWLLRNGHDRVRPRGLGQLARAS
jgi:diguanylate cyclase (GGDEF)-like protein/PAS domain S-box-containing protein